MINIFNSYDLANMSMAKGSGGGYKEYYIPLWVYSSGDAYTATTVLGSSFVQKGMITTTASTILSQTRLHILNSNWSASQKFALEASLLVNSGSTGNVGLWDFTTQQDVSLSHVTTTINTFTLIRSGQFILIPGHTYGLSLWTSNATVYLTKAHLVAIMS